MIRREFVLLCLQAGAGSQLVDSTESQLAKSHLAWVVNVLKRVRTIKPGMTRDSLVQVFVAEGGLSTTLSRTFASRDCPYFKVDVKFSSASESSRDRDGRLTAAESSEDIIVYISKPYLELSVQD